MQSCNRKYLSEQKQIFDTTILQQNFRDTLQFALKSCNTELQNTKFFNCYEQRTK